MKIFKSLAWVTYAFIFIIVALNVNEVRAIQNADEHKYVQRKEIPYFFTECFEVDSEGKLYIGVHKGINVYDSSGSFLYSIKINSLGAFSMRFDDKDMLHIAEVREKKIIVFDKQYNIISEKNMEDQIEYDEYQKNNSTQSDAIGNEYKLSNILWHTKVVRKSIDGTKSIVYKIPLVTWILKFSIIILLFIVFLIGAIILLYQTNALKRQNYLKK